MTAADWVGVVLVAASVSLVVGLAVGWWFTRP